MNLIRKRISSLLLLVCMVFTLLPTVAFAKTEVRDSSAPRGTVNVGNSDNLIEALESTTPSIITLDGDMTLSTKTVKMGADHTINTGSYTLTISGGETYSTGGRIDLGTHTLTLNGVAVIDSVQGIRAKDGTLNLEDVTLTLQIAYSIWGGTVNVNSGATVNLNSSRSDNGNQLLVLGDSASSLNVNSGGVVNISGGSSSGIENMKGGTININSGGTISVGKINGQNRGINQQGAGALKLNTGGTLEGIEGGGVYLNSGTYVEGMNGKFIDQGTTLTATGRVKVGNADATPTNGGLSAGLYVWNDNAGAFAKTDGAHLASLTVNVGTLSPVFDPSVTSYSVSVGYSTASITIGATGEAGTKLSGDGMYDLNVGVNTINVRVLAIDGLTVKEYTIAVTRAADSEGGNGGGGGGSYTPSTPTTTTPEKKPDQPITATLGTGGTASVVISDKTITDAIAKAQADEVAQGKTANGTSVALNVTMPQGATSMTTTLTQSALNSLVNARVTSLEINGGPVSLGLDLNALKEIQKQSDGNVTVSFTPATELSDEARALIGNRPVYNITISYVKDGKPVNITSLGSGTATLSIPYIPGKNEAVGYLFGVYVDAKGKPVPIDGSAYDANSRSILITTNHLSLYGVGYTAPSAKFTDISTHWGKEAIDYVVGRGLLTGTSETTFTPNTAMTRGMLVTALGRLADVDVKAYTTNSFTDVNADSAFRPYIEWAYKKGIIQGIGNQQFAPDRAITREEIAVIFANYAKATGYKLPVTREETTYADAASIGSVYKTAVTAMQQAGIMMGGSENKFNPKSSATRGEVSSMLYRYIKLTIDSATLQD